MSGYTQLPQWVSILQALAVPVVALVGVGIAAQQMKIARDKLRLDAFDRQYARRVAVYEATRDILAKVYRDLSEDDIKVYGLCTLDAEFLFSSDMCKYLKELRNTVHAWKMAESKSEGSSGDERADWEQRKRVYLDWIRQQGDETTGFSSRFRPFLIPPVKPHA